VSLIANDECAMRDRRPARVRALSIAIRIVAQ
jgi:hypothetical protein